MDLWKFNIRHLRALVAIARSGSLSRAARTVNLTQPAVTQGIAKLERQLELVLFDRQPAGMVMTEVCQMLIGRVETVLSLIGNKRVTASQMRSLVALARSGGYTRAAILTGLAEASLHRAVSDLSLALGERLVERRGRNVGLTERGQVIARGFRLAYAEFASALAELDELKGRKTGRIAIGAMPLCRARLLPSAVATFHIRYPQIKIVIFEGSHSELIGPLRDGELDMMIGALRDPATGNELEQLPLFEDRPVIIGRKGHALSGKNVDARSLADFPWIISAPGTPLRDHWEGMFTEVGLAVPHVPIECGSVMTIRQLLLTGDFLTMLSPDQIALELETGWLVKICDPPGLVSRTIGITTRSGWTPTPRQKSFLDLLGSLGSS